MVPLPVTDPCAPTSVWLNQNLGLIEAGSYPQCPVIVPVTATSNHGVDPLEIVGIVIGSLDTAIGCLDARLDDLHTAASCLNAPK